MAARHQAGVILRARAGRPGTAVQLAQVSRGLAGGKGEARGCPVRHEGGLDGDRRHRHHNVHCPGVSDRRCLEIPCLVRGLHAEGMAPCRQDGVILRARAVRPGSPIQLALVDRGLTGRKNEARGCGIC